MAATTSTSDPLKEANDRFENQLVNRFTDPVQTSTLLIKWLTAQSAFHAAQHQPDYALARVQWENGCRLMAKVDNFEVLCTMLDDLTKKLVQPETVVTRRKRKKAASAATVCGREEPAFVFGHTREQASLPTLPRLNPV